MIKNPSSGDGGTIADGSITEAKLDADLTNKVNAVGSVAEGSITSFHIANGTILGTDIGGNTITSSNIADGTILGTDISFGQIGELHLDASFTAQLIGFGDTLNAIIAEGAITSYNIADGSILGTDISNGTITQAKLHPDIQTYLADIGQSLYNLEYPGFWGTFKFVNDNRSDTGAELIITAETRYYNPVNDTYDTILILPTPETITKGSHYTITIPIGKRLTNNITIIRMYYTINKAVIEITDNIIFNEEDKNSDVNGDYYDFIFGGNYDDNNGGNAEISFLIADNI
jgi:hypothetical protein